MTGPGPAAGDATSARREALQVAVGVALFVLVGPIVIGLVLFLGILLSTVIADAVDALHLGRRIDPETSMVVATGLMLVVLRFGWLLVYGALLVPSSLAGAALAIRQVVFGPASWRFAAATGLAVGLIADLGVIGYGHALLGTVRIAVLAGWVVIGSLVATLACWRLAAMTPRAALAR